MPRSRLLAIFTVALVASCGRSTLRTNEPDVTAVPAPRPPLSAGGKSPSPPILAISGDLGEGVCVVRNDFRAECWGADAGWQDIVAPFVAANQFRDVSVNEAGLCGLFVDNSAGCVGRHHGPTGWANESFRVTGPFMSLGQSREAQLLCAIEVHAQRPFCWKRSGDGAYLVFAATAHRAISGPFGLATSGKVWTTGFLGHGFSQELDICSPRPCTNLFAIREGVCGVDGLGTANCLSADGASRPGASRVVFPLVERPGQVAGCGGDQCCQSFPGYVRCRDALSSRWSRAEMPEDDASLMSVGTTGVCVGFQSGVVQCVSFSDFVPEV